MTALKDAKYKSKSVFNLQENRRAKLELIKKQYENDIEQVNAEHAIQRENFKKQARENEGKLRYEIKKLKQQNEDLVFEHKRQIAELEMTHDEEIRRLKLHIEFVTTGSEKAVSNHQNEIDAVKREYSKRDDELRKEMSVLWERLGSVKKDHEEEESLLKNEIFGIKTAKKEVEARHRQVIDDLWKENTTIAEKYQKQLDDVQKEKERIERIFLAETGQLKEEWKELREELQKFKVKFDFSLPSPQPAQNTPHFPYPESRPTSYPSSETLPSSHHSSQQYPSSQTLPSDYHHSSQNLTNHHSRNSPTSQTLPSDYRHSSQNITNHHSHESSTSTYPPYATIKPFQERVPGRGYPNRSTSPTDVNYSTIDFDPSTSHLDKDGYEQPMSQLNHEKPRSHQEKPPSQLPPRTDSVRSSFSSHSSWAASLERNGFLRKSKGKKGTLKKTRSKSSSNLSDDWL